MSDFVNFKLAQKLKEKGFADKCLTYYDVKDNVGILFNTQYTDDISPCQYTDLLQSHNNGTATKQQDDSEYCIDCPTISQVLKWLRDEKGIHVCIMLGEFSDWVYEVSRIYGNVFCEAEDDFKSYEQAALAGVNYCLDNLI